MRTTGRKTLVNARSRRTVVRYDMSGNRDRSMAGSTLVSQAIRIFPRAHARGKGGGEGKKNTSGKFSFRLPECWQSQ